MVAPATTPEPPYTLKQAATLIGCSPGKVRLLCLAGEIEHRRVGVLYAIPRPAIDAYLSRTTIPARTPDQPSVSPSTAGATPPPPRQKPTGKRSKGPVVFSHLRPRKL